MYVQELTPANSRRIQSCKMFSMGHLCPKQANIRRDVRYGGQSTHKYRPNLNPTDYLAALLSFQKRSEDQCGPRIARSLEPFWER